MAQGGDKYEVNMCLAIWPASRFRIDKASEDSAFQDIWSRLQKWFYIVITDAYGRQRLKFISIRTSAYRSMH